MTYHGLNIPEEQLADFCKRWKITELALFGSILREDFRPESDVDILVAFSQEAEWTLLDHVEMQDELQAILGRKVDLISRRGIENSRNSLRREAILRSSETIYVAA